MEELREQHQLVVLIQFGMLVNGILIMTKAMVVVHKMHLMDLTQEHGLVQLQGRQYLLDLL